MPASLKPLASAPEVSSTPGTISPAQIQQLNGILVHDDAQTTDRMPDLILNEGDTTVLGPGVNEGNFGGWTAAQDSRRTLRNFTRGIKQGAFVELDNYAEGDAAGLYAYVNTVPSGLVAPSDEGTTGMNLNVVEWDGHLHGTVAATTGTGDTLPALGNLTVRNWLTDGGILLNISKGTISGRMTGPSVPIAVPAGAPTYLNGLPIATADGKPLPLTTAWGCLARPADGSLAIPSTGRTANISVPITLNVMLLPIPGQASPPPFAVGDALHIAGEYRDEQTFVTAAGPVLHGAAGPSQSITLTHRYPNRSAFFFRGPLAHQYLSFGANMRLAQKMGVQPLRTAYVALGSLDGVHLIYILNALGSAGTTLPLLGCEAAQSDGGPNSDIALFPGAENIYTRGTVDRNHNFQLFGPTLEPNTVPWQTGDVVEATLPRLSGGHGAWINRTHTTPSLRSFDDVGLEAGIGGLGAAGASAALRVVNYGVQGRFDHYKAEGGPLDKPVAIPVRGKFGTILGMEFGPDPKFLPDGSQSYGAFASFGHVGSRFVIFSSQEGPNELCYDPETDRFVFGDLEAYDLNVHSLASAGPVTLADYQPLTASQLILDPHSTGCNSQVPLRPVNDNTANPASTAYVDRAVAAAIAALKAATSKTPSP